MTILPLVRVFGHYGLNSTYSKKSNEAMAQTDKTAPHATIIAVASTTLRPQCVPVTLKDLTSARASVSVDVSSAEAFPEVTFLLN